MDCLRSGRDPPPGDVTADAAALVGRDGGAEEAGPKKSNPSKDSPALCGLAG